MAGKVDSINSNLSYNMYLTTLKSRGVANAGAVNPVIKSTGVDAKVDTVQFGNSTNNAQLKAELTARVNTVSADLKKAEDNNGFIGKAWSWTKNTFGFGDSSNKVKKSQSKEKELLANFYKDPKGTFEQLTGVPYTAANIERFNRGEIKLKSEQNLDGYKEGQDMCVDITGDIVSGVVALGAVAAAPFTGGASLLLAAGAGALVKTGIKYADAKSAGREYDSFARDMATGAFSGLLAPITGGAGGAIGKAVASRLGLEAVQIGVKSVAVNAASQTAKQGLKQGLKTIIANPAGYTYTGGNILKRGVAYGVEMATDGALGGAVDNAFRTAYDGGSLEDVLNSAKDGFIGGALFAPVVGGGFKIVGHAGHFVNNKITTKNILPDGVNTKFVQGEAPDCAVLSVLDGMLDNPATLNKIKRAISRDFDGNYSVNIGDKTVIVQKSAITDEMLADKSGIKIFEAAYRTLTGELDGGFADVAAKHFGLNPVHIESSMITDETLALLAREKGNGVFSFGAKIDANGNIAKEGTPHYFSIKDIDTTTKKVRVVDTYDTSKVVELSFEDIKKYGISIDGGTIKPSQLPNTARHIDDVKFKGKSAGELKRAILDQTGLSEKEFEQLLEFSANYNVDILSKKLEYLGLSEKDIASVFEKDELKLLLEMDDKAEDIFKDRILPVLTGVDTYSVVTSSPSLKPFHLTLKDASEIMDAVQNRDFAKIDSILRRVNEDLYEELGGYNYLQQTLPTTKKLNENILATVIDDKNIRTLDVEINGCKKTIKVLDDEVLSPQATSRTATVKDMEKILDSNMLTTDFIQFLKNNNLEHLISNSPTDVRIKVEQWKKGSNGLEDLTFTKDVPMSFWNVVDKITTDGVIDPKKMSDLTEFEVHLLTDKISDCFKKLDLNVQNNFVQSVSAKTNGIYRYVEALADKARRNPDVKSGKVIIDDHVYMRMLDRDLVNVIDLTAIPPSMMGFNQLVDNLVEAAKKGQTKLEGLETVGGISMILENGPKGAKVIRTVMM